MPKDKETQKELHDQPPTMKADFRELKQEMGGRFKEVRESIDELARITQAGFLEMGKKLTELRTEMKEEFQLVNNRLDAIENSLVAIRKELKTLREEKADREETHHIRLRIAQLEDEIAAIKKQL